MGTHSTNSSCWGCSVPVTWRHLSTQTFVLSIKKQLLIKVFHDSHCLHILIRFHCAAQGACACVLARTTHRHLKDTHPLTPVSLGLLRLLHRLPVTARPSKESGLSWLMPAPGCWALAARWAKPSTPELRQRPPSHMPKGEDLTGRGAHTAFGLC